MEETNEIAEVISQSPNTPAPVSGTGCYGHPDSTSAIRKRDRW
ncbi:hypothetical protein T03_3477 [Trichinella britovi]|uniref:Uncharacterized protein n=1 Tax=Trichinella britovi TaxID=45882 RepID=A0A0V0Z0Y6_TRIBR|nr:hypothetical protein T03_3477 [Trichinella britovi]